MQNIIIIRESYLSSCLILQNLADEEVMKGSTTTKTLEPSYNTYPTLGIHNECKSKGIFRRRKDRPLKIQERKVVRSNSEERIIKKNICNKSIRRVSSHEDFKRVPSHEDFKRVQITDATLKENEIPNTNIKSFDVIVKPFDVKSHKFDVKSQQFDVKSQKFEVKPQKFDAKSQKFDAKSQRFDVPRQNFDKLHIDATSQQCNFKHLNVSQYDVYQFDFNKYHMRHFAVVSQNLDSKIEEESNNMNVETNASELEASMDTVDIFQASEAPKNDTKNLDSIDQTELDKFDKLGQSKLDAAKSDYSKLNYSKFDHSKLDCSKFDSSMTDPVKFDPSFSTSTFDSIKFDPSKFDAAYFDSSKFDALSTGTKQNPFKYSHKLDSKFETMKYEAKSFELNKFDVQKHEVQFDLSTDPKKLDIKKTEKKIGDINPIKYDIKKLESKKSEAFNQDEYEWKRSGERLFRVPLHRRKYFYKRSPKVKHMSSQHDDKSNSEESYKSKDFYLSKDTLPLPENSFGKKESSSPYQSPSSSVLDLSALHKQIDCSEPIPSSTVRPVSEITEYSETMPGSAVAQNALLSSPRNSIIATERIYLNQYVAQNKNTSMKPLNPLEKRLNHLSKQMKKIKKNIRQFEYEFEQKRGYKPSEMDKMRDFNINSLLTDLQNLKKEYKQIKRYDRDVQVHPTAHEEYTGKMNVQQSLAETLSEIDQVNNKIKFNINI